MPKLINLNIDDHNIYYEPHLNLVKPIYKNLIPDQFLFQVVSGDRDKGLEPQTLDYYFSRMQYLLSQEFSKDSFFDDINSREYFMTFILFSSDYLLLHGHAEEAKKLLQIADEIRPNQASVEFYLGQTWIILGKEIEGIQKLKRIIAREPYYQDPKFVLSREYLSVGQVEKSEFYSDLNWVSGKKDLNYIDYLIELYWRKGEIEKAKAIYNKYRKTLVIPEELETIKTWEIIFDDSI